MKSVTILIVYAFAAAAQRLFNQFEWYRALYQVFPFFVPESIKVGAGVIACVAVARWLYGRGDHFALQRGFSGGLVFGGIASMPMLVGFALTRSIHIANALSVLFLAALFPLAEEVVSRGFAFRLLHLREHWNWWMAAGVVAAVTGAAHVSSAQSATEVLGLFALTGVGGFLFSWLMMRWGSLWFAFGLHLFMNLWWEVFSVSRIALGGWFAFAMQLACIFAAVIITLRIGPRQVRLQSGAVARKGDRTDSLMLAASTR
jgi:membrane protease YdiL (CAAX protease family)